MTHQGSEGTGYCYWIPVGAVTTKEKPSGRSCNCRQMQLLLEIWHSKRWEEKQLLFTTSPLPVPTIDWIQPEASQQGCPRDGVCGGQLLWAHRKAQNGSEGRTGDNQHRHWLNPFHQKHFLADALPQVQHQWEIRPTVYQILEILKARIHCWDLILWEMSNKYEFLLQKPKSTLALIQFWRS